jgi:poly-gamma-glutamate capsule biosynthesis protein CapA/YwtB (metallophosphatase superfamily)
MTDELTITLTGQAMIRGDTRADAPGAVAGIRSLLSGEVAFTNYEAAVYDEAKGESTRSGRFASPPASLDALTSFGFNLLALANNHSFDLGVPGILNTVEAVKERDIAHAGTGVGLAEASAFSLLKTDNATIGFVAFASGLVLDGRAEKTRPGVNELSVRGNDPDDGDAERILDSIREAKVASDLVVVSQHNHHYPGVERPEDFKQLLLSELPERLGPPVWLETWAHRMVDAGADVVAMHGPPFLHGMEFYKGVPIFYSLGNFIFQVPPESVHLEEPIMWESVVAQLRFSDGNLADIKLQPIGMNKVGTGTPNPHDQFDVNEYHRTRGLPRAVHGKQAQFLLERFTRQSARYGTEVAIADGVGTLAIP